MPRLTQEKVIREYWEQVKQEYPDMNYAKFKSICRTPFMYVKQLIKSDEFVRILIKYFGKFTVFPGKIVKMMRNNLKYRTLGFVTQEEYERKLKFYKELFEKVKYEYDTEAENPEDQE